ncbi:copper resistance protein B [Sphingopyxis sp. PET50]|uniref:copper resistance protein B n=1 Tax=Sphingopyxis sp. PET50 TaxID=2976533 RepID=UPI0021AEC5E4|nr:copper resistance protein B [Sphingopyxis sp. PET50]
MRALLLLPLLALASPAAAQDHSGHVMPEAPTADPHAGHRMPTDTPVGDAPAPTPPTDHAADAVYDRAAMERARAMLTRESGGMSFSKITLDLAEVQIRDGADAYRWEGEAWFGGDIDRLKLKYEGEGEWGGAPGHAEVQARYSRAIDPWWDVSAGIRYDIAPNPSRTYAAIGIEGVAPYWFHLEGTAFVSTKGDVHLRAEGSYDQRITQRLILQPRVEANAALQDVPELGIGGGLSDVELGLRLRYEIVPEFAPYVGVEYARKIGDTARFARAAGEGVGGASFVAGVRLWF